MEYAIRLKGLTKSFQKEKVLKNITHGIEFVKCCVNIKSIFQGLSVAFWVHHS